MDTDPTPPYVEARRALLELWEAKRMLFTAARSKFPSTHPLYTSIYNLIHDPAVNKARMLADGSACAFADIHGDELFSKEVDGVHLLSVTHWFWGLDNFPPAERTLTKSLGVAEFQMFRCVETKTLVFFDKVSMLPLADAKVLARCLTQAKKQMTKAAKIIEKYSDGFAAFRYIETRIPVDLTIEVFHHCNLFENASSASSSDVGRQGRKRPRS